MRAASGRNAPTTTTIDRTVPALARSLDSSDAIVREHAAWALGRIGGGEAGEALRLALEGEEDAPVRSEIELSLAGIGAAAGSA